MGKLDLGCGATKLDGFDGIDKVDHGQKYVHDLEDIPWPIQGRSIDEIRAFNILEHIHQDKVIAVMNECHRILKEDGKMHIKVPRFPHYNAVVDPTHLSYWHERTFMNYFAGKRPRNADYGMEKWSICLDKNKKHMIKTDHCSIDVWLSL